MDREAIDRCVRVTGGGVELRVKVVPGASRTRIAGVLGDRLRVQVAAAPEAGRANAALCRLLAATLGVPARAVAVTEGLSQPRKTVTISGISVESLAAALDRR